MSTRFRLRALAVTAAILNAATAFADNRDSRESYDPAFNVCRGTDIRCYHDWAREQREGNRVLIYTRVREALLLRDRGEARLSCFRHHQCSHSPRGAIPLS